MGSRFRFLDKRLTHIAILTQSSTIRDGYGKDTATVTTTLSCLIYQDSEAHRQDKAENTNVLQWVGLLPASATVNEGDELVSIVDDLGAEIFPRAVIERILVFRHRRDNIRAIQVFLKVD